MQRSHEKARVNARHVIHRVQRFRHNFKVIPAEEVCEGSTCIIDVLNGISDLVALNDAVVALVYEAVSAFSRQVGESVPSQLTNEAPDAGTLARHR